MTARHRSVRSRSRTTVVAAVVVAVACVVAVVTGHETRSPAVTVTGSPVFPLGQRLSGVVVPGASVGEAFGSWRGRPEQVIVSYSGTKTWAGVLGLQRQGLSCRRAPAYDGSTACRSSPQMPTQPSSQALRVRTTSTGASSASSSCRAARHRPRCRLGWEMNGTWFAWNGTGDPLAWVGAYRHAVTALRSVPGEQFSFDWSIAVGATDPARLYPGDGYVDLVGGDLYDVSSTTRASDHAAVWRELLSQPYGLDWLAGFSAQHGKRISLAEWGLSERCDGNGGGDDPAYIERMHGWMDAHDVAYEAYFDTLDRSICATFAIDSGSFPKAAARYKALFGGITSRRGLEIRMPSREQHARLGVLETAGRRGSVKVACPSMPHPVPDMTTTETLPLGPPEIEPRRRPSLVKTALTVGALLLVGVLLVVQRGQLVSAVAALRHLHWWWVVAAIALEVVSMGAFARLQRAMLRAGGTRLPITIALGITYAGNAISVSLPLAGPEVGTLFAYKQFQRRGATQVTAAWTVLASGVVSSVAFTLVVVGGALVSTNPAAATAGAIGGLTLIVPVVLALVAVRVPGRRAPGSSGWSRGCCGWSSG